MRSAKQLENENRRLKKIRAETHQEKDRSPQGLRRGWDVWRTDESRIKAPQVGSA